MSTAATILIIDDDESIRIGCTQTLEEEGYHVESVEDGMRGLQLCGEKSFDVVLLDLKMPGMNGMEVLKKLRESNPGSAVIINTGYGTIASAVEAIKKGAYDYITKPFEPETLLSMVRNALEHRLQEMQSSCLRMALDDTMIGEHLIGRSAAMAKVSLLIKKVAPMDSTVLITGETGSGKELVARTIHRLSRRQDKPFVTVDCGALVETLFESEMFGHVRGSFTGAVETTRGKFELADGGTMFLDEIANISYTMQSRLLRVIQEREFFKVGSSERKAINVRIIAATNKNLQDEIQNARFREDLYYRLNVVHIAIPPLRERLEDIADLSHYFLKKMAQEKGMKKMTLSPEALRFYKTQEWPGNIRELRNTLEHACIVCEGSVIGPHDLSPQGSSAHAPPEPATNGALAETEKKEIIRALKMFNGHKTNAAKFLGINRKTLREKIVKYDLADQAF
ncbi:MAG: sigma-54-dependent Fis family transcriptional regulator [Chitinispirillaceae bacterium]|nr:sigma-54-dependent Fis family transcriptional regulator [Chitinispirillaceae bacterium]